MIRTGRPPCQLRRYAVHEQLFVTTAQYQDDYHATSVVRSGAGVFTVNTPEHTATVSGT